MTTIIVMILIMSTIMILMMLMMLMMLMLVAVAEAVCRHAEHRSATICHGLVLNMQDPWHADLSTVSGPSPGPPPAPPSPPRLRDRMDLKEAWRPASTRSKGLLEGSPPCILLFSWVVCFKCANKETTTNTEEITSELPGRLETSLFACVGSMVWS